jgi:upstream activation factor subunit UAF30
MPRQSKTKTEVTETVPAVNTPVVNVDTNEKATKAKRESKPKAPKVEAASTVTAPVTASVPVEAPVTEPVDGDVVDLTAQTTEFLTKLNQLSSLFGGLKNEFRSLEKKWSRELKTAQKSQAKRKRKSGNRQPSGFVKPTKISDELAKFLEKPTGTEMARTDVTREINKYIRSHNLQDKENGRKINPDTKLQNLLKLKKTDELTYFNLQRFMSPHFEKSAKSLAAAAAVAAATA